MPTAWHPAATRLMWAACAIVLVSVVLAVGLLSPARAAWGVGSVYAGGIPGSESRKVRMSTYQEPSSRRVMQLPSCCLQLLAEQ